MNQPVGRFDPFREKQVEADRQRQIEQGVLKFREVIETVRGPNPPFLGRAFQFEVEGVMLKVVVGR